MKTSFELGRGIVFVSGLHWQPLPGNPSEGRREARRLGKKLNFDLAIQRTTGIAQVGFAGSSEGFRAGMLSAAAVISKTMEMDPDGECRDFIVACELPDGRFLYVAQANGAILSDGDFIASEEEVRSRMLADLSLGKEWELVVAPLLWGIDQSTERKFEDFLPKKNGKIQYKLSWWRLKPIAPGLGALGGRAKFMLALAVVVLLAGGLVFKKISGGGVVEMPHAEQPPPPPPPPWGGMPRAASAAAGCNTAFDQALSGAWTSNWIPVSVACAPSANAVTLQWKQGDGAWIQHLLAVQPAALISSDGKTATRSFVATIAPNQSGPEPVNAERPVTLRLMMQAETLGLKLALSSPQSPPPMPGAPDQAPAPTWKELSWSVAAQSLEPGVVVGQLDGPGFRVTEIKGVFKNGQILWELEGKQYVLP